MPPRLNSITYLAFLQHTLPRLLNEQNLRLEEIMYQQDGAPAHYGSAVRQHLDRTFPRGWVGRAGTAALWPARSPDFSPLDYWLWGHVKSLVYMDDELFDEQVCERRIIEAFEQLDGNLIRRSIADIIRRAETCLQVDGGHFEQFPH